MNAIEYKLGFDPFKPPADLDGIDAVFWPTIQDQIDLIQKRLDQTTRALEYYLGGERDYGDLTREKVFLAAVLHTLNNVRDLQQGKPPVE